MISNKKALFFDIDGTLLSDVTYTVPESARAAIQKTREKGNLVFINTGRTYCLVGPIKEMIEVDGYCCGCGTRVIVGDQVMYSSGIPHELGIRVKKDVQKYNLDGVLEGTESCYFQKKTSRIPRIEALKESVDKMGCVSPYGWEEDCYDYDKLCVIADEHSNMAGFSRALGLDFDIIDRGDRFYECVPAGHSKATAIEIVLEHYGIPRENAYVFGDSTNDLSMFEYAKNCVLMGHHDVELEPYATFFTKNVEDDGIAYAMEKLGLV
jgi:hypothetical protein